MILILLILFPLLEHLCLPSTGHMCLVTKLDNSLSQCNFFAVWDSDSDHLGYYCDDNDSSLLSVFQK